MNCIMLECFAVDKPTMNTIASGANRATLMVLSQRSYKVQNKEKWDRFVVFAWGTMADNLARHVSKGSRLFIRGCLENRFFKKNGKDRFTVYILAQEVKFLGEKSPEELDTKLKDYEAELQERLKNLDDEDYDIFA